MQHALLLVDIQNDYFPGGAMELAGSEEAGERAGQVLQTFRANNLLVIHIQHVATRPDATFFLPDSPGVALHSRVSPLRGEMVLQKHFPNSFRKTALLEHLRRKQVSRLTIAGMMTHMCIDSTTRAAADFGFQCTLVHDACATRSLVFNGVEVGAAQVQAVYLAALDGLFATVHSAAQVCASL